MHAVVAYKKLEMRGFVIYVLSEAIIVVRIDLI